MPSYTQVANMAASLIGEEDQLRSPADDTHLGRTIAAVWDMCRRAAIRDHTWNMAMRRAALAAEALESVPYPWAYSFPLPADSLRLVEVLNISSRSDYQLEGKSILSDTAGPLYIRYLVDITEPALWDDLFAEAFSRRLAYQIGPRLAGSDYDKPAGWKVYQDALNQAKRVDARENPQVRWEPTDWELARGGRLGYGCRTSDGWGG